MFSKTEDKIVQFTKLLLYVCVDALFIFLIDFEHRIEITTVQTLIKRTLNVPKMQKMFLNSPKFSLALYMYSSDFKHKFEVIRSR